MSDIETKSLVTLEQKDNEQIQQRKQKLQNWRAQNQAYPNDFKRDFLTHTLHARYGSLTHDELEQQAITVHIAGRMMTRRIMGKASFIHLQDMGGQIQLYIARDQITAAVYEDFKTWDLGDILGATGTLFKTKTGELSVKVDTLRLLTKALHPLPDKFHGLQDHEQRFRQRYLDLMMNETSREKFQLRSKLVTELRNYLNQHGFVEVETPMMHIQAGGASAKPFMTHHNALDMELFLRIAPELYLKRLVVGGIEKVYEINRNFRNEGLSTKHNPEFTMLEFYQAYATYTDLMEFSEQMLRYLAEKLLGRLQLTYQNIAIDLSLPFARYTIKEAILQHNPDISSAQLEDFALAKKLAEQHGIAVHSDMGLGKIQMELFEALVEDQLLQPTFITEFPTEVSPLARKNEHNPFVTDRFELFIAGRELANGFSELNDPEDQAQRFQAQLKAREAGDEEAMSYDEDYILALEYGLPPTAGEGIGIDRLAMLFTDSPSIREVILFPLLRQKSST